ncbi:AraC family transcriptional regulator [Nocardia lasii]|uniref:Helix-turn-helix domain-containing protein n=1 Tax=Nocardia lasii TaxID=1616107 RepID=A0ABW1JP23_9NOCA
MQGYRERPSRLDRAVLWSRTGAAGPVTVFPDGCMDLIWTEGTLLVAGPDSHPFLAPGARSSEFVGIRFAPGTAPTLLGIPAVEVVNQRVDLAAIAAPSLSRELVDRLDNAPDRVAAMEAIALRFAADQGTVDPAITAVVDGLTAGSTVGRVAADTGMSTRTLHRRSLLAFGYGPKMLARILRFQRALAAVRAGLPAARVAAETGFADQAHLAREFRELAGCSPRAVDNDDPLPGKSHSESS